MQKVKHSYKYVSIKNHPRPPAKSTTFIVYVAKMV